MAPQAQPVLRTRRIRLVPLSDEHLDFEVSLDAEPDVMRYLGNGRRRTRAEVEERHRGRLAASRRIPGLGFWAGFTADDFVGLWILEPPDRPDQGPATGQAELGYRLLPRFWRLGLAKEGALELIRYGFEDVGLRRIFAETMAVNEASRATMSAVGLRYEKTLWNLDFPESISGSELGEVVYAITEAQWRADGASSSQCKPSLGHELA